MSAPTCEEVYGRLNSLLVSTLRLDAKTVTRMATLEKDLGVDSLGMEDIMAHVTAEFGFGEKELDFPSLGMKFAWELAPYSDDRGVVAQDGIDNIKGLYPWADFSALERKRHISAILDLMNVGLLAAYIHHQLSAGVPAQ